MLKILDRLPEGLLGAQPHRLHDLLGGATLIHLPGRRSEPLFISVLVHGNEPSGFFAVQRILQKYAEKELPRALSLFIGNVEAAQFDRRFLENQPDYNRIWTAGDRPENAMARVVLDEVRRRRPIACVDVHNTSGINPHHSCVTRLENEHLQLAAMFGRQVVYLHRAPFGTLSGAFSAFCPSVTVESGRCGQAYGTEHAMEYLEGCLHLDHFPPTPVHTHDLELFRMVAIIKVPEKFGIGFGMCGEDICLRNDIDRLNFSLIPPGTVLATVKPESSAYLEAWDESGNDVRRDFFAQENGEIKTTRRVMPSMLTLKAEAVRQDCLCYFMEAMEPPSGVS